MPAPRRFDHEAAFVWWYSQPFRPSYDVVAAEFGVAQQSLRDVADREDWKGRAEYLDAQVREETDKRLKTTAAERNATMLSLCDHLIALFAKRLMLPQDDPGALRPGDLSVREMTELARVIQLLQGSPTDRHTSMPGDADRKSLEELEAEMEEMWLYELERQAAEADTKARAEGQS